MGDNGPFTSLGTWYAAQLSWHMLCLGSECKSCILMSCSPTKGVNLFRVQRDDAYIARMLYFVGKFYKRYLDTCIDTGKITVDDAKDDDIEFEGAIEIDRDNDSSYTSDHQNENKENSAVMSSVSSAKSNQQNNHDTF